VHPVFDPPDLARFEGYHCARCDYELRSLSRRACPECGQTLQLEVLREYADDRARWRRGVRRLLRIAGGYAGVITAVHVAVRAWGRPANWRDELLDGVLPVLMLGPSARPAGSDSWQELLLGPVPLLLYALLVAATFVLGPASTITTGLLARHGRWREARLAALAVVLAVAGWVQNLLLLW